MAIFNIKYKNGHKIINILGVKISLNNNIFSKIDKQFAVNKDFDCRKFDEKIAKKTDKLLAGYNFKKSKINNNKIAILATEFNDKGGHTECVKNLVSLLSGDYGITTFLTKKDNTYEYAPTKIKIIEKNSVVDGLPNYKDGDIKQNIINLYNKISDLSPRVVFVYMHMYDSFSAALLYLLKKYTDIKIVYFNHGTHLPALGMIFAHTILEEIPTTKQITNERRHLYNCTLVGLQSNKKEDIKYYTEEEKNLKRKELNIPEGALITISGGSSYKYFDNHSSPHFEMIKRLLEKENNLYHIMVTSFSEEEQLIVDKIFGSSKVKARFINLDFTPQYDLLFQLSDLFIDSFPMSSAMTQIDIMSMRVPTVVKINTENIELTFHEYMPKDYKYMYEKVEDMEKGILELLENSDKRKEVAKLNYEHWLLNFEGNAVKQKYIDVINNIIVNDDKNDL